jgi:hypothetical protein
VPLKKVVLTPGINQENTRYTSENGWWVGDKVRFRQGTPEAIGGWVRTSSTTFTGTCRAIYPWVSLVGNKFRAVGTHTNYYIDSGGAYYDITPIRATTTLTDPFTTTLGSTTVTVAHTAHGATTGSTVIFSGATAVAGLTLNGSYVVTVLNANTYTIEAALPADSAATGGGTVGTSYVLNIGRPYDEPLEGWSAGGYGFGDCDSSKLIGDINVGHVLHELVVERPQQLGSIRRVKV